MIGERPIRRYAVAITFRHSGQVVPNTFHTDVWAATRRHALACATRWLYAQPLLDVIVSGATVDEDTLTLATDIHQDTA